jgi:hypothetical protein
MSSRALGGYIKQGKVLELPVFCGFDNAIVVNL